MDNSTNMRESLVGFFVIVIGIIAFAIVVYADTTNTSVTVTNASPSITQVSFNDGNDITLTESTFVWASATIDVQDTNSCQDVTSGGSVVAKAYYTSKSTSGTLCTADDVDCYPDTLYSACVASSATGKNCTGASDTTVTYDCGFKLWFVASSSDATYDSGDAYVWAVSATATDSSAATGNATNSSQTVDIAALAAINDNIQAIAYGSLAPGDTSAERTNYATSTGNIPIDVQLSESDDLDNGGGDAIAPSQQEYSTTQGFGYGAGTDLSGTPTTLELAIVQNTSTTSLSSDAIYWMLQVPSAQPTGTYTGTTTVTATAD